MKWLRWLRRNILVILDVLKFAGIMVLLLMSINLSVKVINQTRTTQDIVKGEGQILDAIKRAEEDNRLTSEQKADLIICMVKVPVEQRTDDMETNCRKQVNSTALSTPQPAPQPTSQSAATPQPVATPQPTPQPTPAPQPSVAKSVAQTVKTISNDVTKFWRILGP